MTIMVVSTEKYLKTCFLNKLFLRNFRTSNGNLSTFFIKFYGCQLTEYQIPNLNTDVDLKVDEEDLHSAEVQNEPADEIGKWDVF